MKIIPKTEKEIKEANLIPAGVYPFRVNDAAESKSKKGNDMIVLDLIVYMPDGKQRSFEAYLLEAMPAQFFHFCTYSGLSTQYGSGDVSAVDCVDKTGYVEIGIQKGKSKEDGTGDFWPDRNSVKDFVRPTPLKPGEMPSIPPAQPKPSSVPADGIPF